MVLELHDLLDLHDLLEVLEVLEIAEFLEDMEGEPFKRATDRKSDIAKERHTVSRVRRR